MRLKNDLMLTALENLNRRNWLREYGEKYELPYVILRPGYVFGPGKTELNGRVAINTFGFFIQVDGSHLLPLTFVDNCAEAIVLAGLKAGVDGEIFNVVDDELLTGRQFLQAYKKKSADLSVLGCPIPSLHALCLLWEKYSKWSKGQLPPVFNRRRCAAEWKGNRYSNQKLKDRLGWKPRVPMKEAMEAFLGAVWEIRGRRTTEVRGQKADDGSLSRSAYVKTTTRQVNR